MPIETAKEFWSATFQKRQQLTITIDEYYKTFPLLSGPVGYIFVSIYLGIILYFTYINILILFKLEEDFNLKFPEKHHKFYSKWPLFASALVKHLSKNKSASQQVLQETISRIDISNISGK